MVKLKKEREREREKKFVQYKFICIQSQKLWGQGRRMT